MNKEELKTAWQKYSQGNDFILNPKEEQVDQVIAVF